MGLYQIGIHFLSNWGSALTLDYNHEHTFPSRRSKTNQSSTLSISNTGSEKMLLALTQDFHD
jgi:hypothetical protein